MTVFVSSQCLIWMYLTWNQVCALVAGICLSVRLPDFLGYKHHPLSDMQSAKTSPTFVLEFIHLEIFTITINAGLFLNKNWMVAEIQL